MEKTDNAFNVKTADDSPGFLLWQVTTLWQRGIKKALDAIDLTHPQFVLLASLLWLSGQQDSVMQIDLSQHSKIDPMTTSTVIRTLERKGLVERREHHTDTRAKTITLSENGLATTRKALKIVEQFDKAFFSLLDNNVGDFNRYLRALSAFSQ